MTTLVRSAVQPPELKRVLKYGTSGPDVKYLQELLQKSGAFVGTPLGNFKTLTKDAVKYFQGTHINEQGEFLKVDGEVGQETWWALHNAEGSAQRNFIPTEEIVQEVSNAVGSRERLIKFCYDLHLKGVREIPDGANYGDGVTPIVNACGYHFGIYWCLAAVSYAWKETYGEPPLGAMHVSCSSFWNEAKKRGMAYPKANYKPMPGDIAIYNYGSGLNSKGELSGSGHALIVARVSESGDQFNAYEGNIGNRYKFSIRKQAERTLVGYVNLHGDAKNRPYFKPGITQAPVIVASYAGTR